MADLPALIARPDAVLPNSSGVEGPVYASLTISVDTGVPARIVLDGSRTVLVAVPLGQARRWMGNDPRTVVVDSSTAAAPMTPPGVGRTLDQPGPRLTLLEAGAVGDTAAFTPGLPTILTMGGRAVVEIVIDSLTLTVGSLRSPGLYGSSIQLRWRDLRPAGNTGPALSLGDATIPRQLYRWIAKAEVE
jgi:hypothetical protein